MTKEFTLKLKPQMYPFHVGIIYSDDPVKVTRYGKRIICSSFEFPDVDGPAWTVNDLGCGNSMICLTRPLNKPIGISDLAHEATHAAIHAGNHLGYPPLEGQEFYAYLTGYIVKETLDKYKNT